MKEFAEIATLKSSRTFMDSNEIKTHIAETAVPLVQNGMVIGLGTGSTAQAFIRILAGYIAAHKIAITTVSSSKSSEELAKSLKIPTVPIDTIDHIDITFDGADEVDPQKRLIKGAGGALLREKILASACREFIVLVEEKKCVSSLGKAKLPLEVTPFGHNLTCIHLKSLGEELGFKVELRKKEDGSPYITDNNNFIYDIWFKSVNFDPEEYDKRFRQIPGVIETGFFFHLANKVFVGKSNGQVTVL